MILVWTEFQGCLDFLDSKVEKESRDHSETQYRDIPGNQDKLGVLDWMDFLECGESRVLGDLMVSRV